MVEINANQHEKEDRCPKCDGKGTIDAPPDGDGDDRPAICPECRGTGKSPRQRKPNEA